MPGQLNYHVSGHRVVDLSGDDAFERGYAHGSLLKSEINQIIFSLHRIVRVIVEGKLASLLNRYPVWLRPWIISWYCFLFKRHCLKSAMDFYPLLSEDLKREIQGIARGSAQKLTHIVLINAFDDIAATLGCSAVALRPNSGTFTFGYNLDYFVFTDEIAKLITVFRVKTSKEQFISVGVPGYIGMLRGMNQHGLVLGYLTSTAVSKLGKGLPVGIFLRLALTQRQTLEDLVSFIVTNPPIQGINILAGDVRWAQVIECGITKCRVRHPQSFDWGLGNFVTNHFELEDMVGLQGQEQAPLIPVRPAHLATRNHSRHSLRALRESASNLDQATLENCRLLLGNAEVCHAYTVSCCLFDPANLKMVIVSNQGKTPATRGQPQEYFLN